MTSTTHDAEKIRAAQRRRFVNRVGNHRALFTN